MQKEIREINKSPKKKKTEIRKYWWKQQNFIAIESSWQWQQISSTIVGLQGLDCQGIHLF
jgi:hypothetical protein